MGFIGRVGSWLGSFPSIIFNADVQQSMPTTLGEFDSFGRWESRQVRYDILWSFYQNNAFWDLMHRWTPSLRTRFGLYKHTRGIFNPIYRLGEFHATHLMGGVLDPEAGSGDETKSCVPIETDSETVRGGIAKLWQESRFAIHKDDLGRKGAVLGDVGLLLQDDPELGRVTMCVVHPGHLKWVDKDRRGRVTGYIIESQRYSPYGVKMQDVGPQVNPQSTKQVCRFNEECWIENGVVTHRTYKDGSLFDWRLAPDGFPIGTREGAQPEWECPYGFVPLVHVQHLNVGLEWGMSEAHALMSKLLEVDDLASNQGDQVRKQLNGPWAILNAHAPRMEPLIGPTGQKPTLGNPQPARTESNMIYFSGSPGQNVDVKAMVATMPLGEVSAMVQAIVTEIERDYPELQMDIWASGDSSGRALRVARQRTESKVQARRVGYDEALVDAQRMALAIGGIRGYEGFAGLAVDDPWDPKLDHSIAHRPVFAPDPLDDTEEAMAFWQMVNQAVQAGMPLTVVLRREGWPEEDITAIEQEKEVQAQKQVDVVRQRMAAAASNGPADAIPKTNGSLNGQPDKVPVGAGEDA